MRSTKKSVLCFIALIITLTAGCGKKPVSDKDAGIKENAAVLEETPSGIGTAEEINSFKSGKWISSKGVYYFFNETQGFFENQDETDKGTDFTYELNDDGSAIFHMGENAQNAHVNFKKPGVIDIEWENGGAETLIFDTEEIPDSIKH